jgi:hypothetical protein
MDSRFGGNDKLSWTSDVQAEYQSERPSPKEFKQDHAEN